MADSSRHSRTKLPPFDVYVESSTLAVREALCGVLKGLEPLHLDIEESGTIELVLSEALNNIVEHAYAPGFGEGPIWINCVHCTNGLHLKIHDKGAAMPEGQTPLGLLPPIGKNVMELPEGGFGWFLINDLARDISYRRNGNKNELSLRLAVGIQMANQVRN